MKSTAVQCASTLMLIRPANFGFNTETADSNGFQNNTNLSSSSDAAANALTEFKIFSEKLSQNNIDVIVVEDTPLPVKPDAVFPNNWFSTHHNGTIVLYPMFAPNRRLERRNDIVEMLKSNFYCKETIDLSSKEEKEMYLEGTGSIVFDHIQKIAFACASARTNKELFTELCNHLSYTPVFFKATDTQHKEIYHCNVVMNISAKFAIVCLDCIPAVEERKRVVDALQKNGLKIIEITMQQMMLFAGNMLSVLNKNQELFLIMSGTAFRSLDTTQKDKISRYANLLIAEIPTIETLGGGSVRCMMAEIFLPKK